MSPIDVTARLLDDFAGLTVCHDPPAEPATDGRFLPPPAALHPLLTDWLAAHPKYQNGLYTHQRQAVDHLLAGRHTVVTTRTSSGKSLLYSLPVFDILLREPDATALFLFPQKALANDQLQRLRTDAASLPPLADRLATVPHLIARYDGGTPKEDREAIRPQVQDRKSVV